MSLAPPPPPPPPPPSSSAASKATTAGDNRGKGPGRTGDGGHSDPSGGGGVNIVAAAGGFSHTALVTSDGRMYLFGEGAAVAGGDLAALEAKGGGVDGGQLREAGGLVRRRRSGEEGEERLDPVAVSGDRPKSGIVGVVYLVGVAAG